MKITLILLEYVLEAHSVSVKLSNPPVWSYTHIFFSFKSE